MILWERDITCKFCKHEFHVTDEDVRYEDLKHPAFFIPDMQYFLVCPQCNENLIINDLPPDRALAVQERVNAENQENE